MTKPPPLPPEHLRDPGDAWVEGPDGSRYWGRFGAAGLLVVHPPLGVLLQLRAEWSHSGGTWGIPGGALKHGEGAIDAALRESHEEAGVPFEAVRVVETSVLDLGFWSYTTVLGLADRYFEPVAMDLESAALEWVPMNDVEGRDLHPAFHRAWPDLRDRLSSYLSD
ncbi:MAG: NUDIX domain-containing protein [Pontimonas sp.]